MFFALCTCIYQSRYGTLLPREFFRSRISAVPALVSPARKMNLSTKDGTRYGSLSKNGYKKAMVGGIAAVGRCDFVGSGFPLFSRLPAGVSGRLCGDRFMGMGGLPIVRFDLPQGKNMAPGCMRADSQLWY